MSPKRLSFFLLPVGRGHKHGLSETAETAETTDDRTTVCRVRVSQRSFLGTKHLNHLSRLAAPPELTEKDGVRTALALALHGAPRPPSTSPALFDRCHRPAATGSHRRIQRAVSPFLVPRPWSSRARAVWTLVN